MWLFICVISTVVYTMQGQSTQATTKLCPGGCLNGGWCVAENLCQCTADFIGNKCETGVVQKCNAAILGIADGRIPSANIEVSSQDPVHTKDELGNVANKTGWCPAVGDGHPWVQIKLDKPMGVKEFYFMYLNRQVGEDNMYMRTFELQYIATVDSSRIFRTFATNIPALNGTHYFSVSTSPVVVTDTIRIKPLSVQGRGCFKLELGGCDPTSLCQAGWCLNNGTCMGENVCQCPGGYLGDRCNETKSSIVSTNLAFVEIQNNVLITASLNFNFLITGNVVLQPVGNTSVVTINGTSSSILLNQSNASTSCLTNIDHCTNGFTFTIDINFGQLLDKTYIVSSGGDLTDHKGIALFYSHNTLTYIVSTSTHTWHLQVAYQPVLHVWQHFEITWNTNLGIELHIDGHLLGSFGQPAVQPASHTLNLCIACSHQTTITVEINMQIKDIFSWSIDRTELVNAGLKPTPVPATTTTAKPTTPDFTTTSVGHTITEDPTTTTSDTSEANTEFTTTTLVYTITEDPTTTTSDTSEANTEFTTTTTTLGHTITEDPTTTTAPGTSDINAQYWTSTEVSEVTTTTTMAPNRSEIPETTTDSIETRKYVPTTTITPDISETTITDVMNTHKLDTTVHDTTPASPDTSKTTTTSSKPSKVDVKLEETTTTTAAQTTSKSPEVPITNTKTTTTGAEVTTSFYITIKQDKTTTQTAPVMTTTSGKPYQEYNLTFISIVNNILITPTFNFTLHGNPKLELENNSQTALVLNCTDNDQYVELPDKGIPCLQDLSGCTKGFTFKLEVLFTEIDTAKKTYILSSGGDIETASGMAIYMQSNLLTFGVKQGIMHWAESYDITSVITTNVWYKFEISWSVEKGISVVIDGYQVIHSKQSTPSPGVDQTHAVLIGKTPGSNITACMKVRNLFSWTTEREVLVTDGILKEPSTILTPSTTSTSASTSASTTTTKPSTHTRSTTQSFDVVLPYDFRFTKIVGNILFTPQFTFEVYGTPHLTILPFNGFILTLDGTKGEFLKLQNDNINCIGNLATCKYGFTIEIAVTFTFLNNSLKTFVISSGAESNAHAGFYMYYQMSELHFGFVYENSKWSAHINYMLDVSAWYTFILTWSHTDGISLYIDGVLQKQITNPSYVSVKTTVTGSFIIGKAIGENYTASMMIAGLQFWSFSFQILVQKNILTTMPTTLGSTIPTRITTFTKHTSEPTTKVAFTTPLLPAATIVSYNFSFTAINGNVIVTPQFTITAHGNPELVLLPSGENAVKLNGSNGDFIVIKNQSLPCSGSEDTCKDGFTLQIGIQFLSINFSQKTYIISSGGKTPGVDGFYMYYQNHKIYFGAAFGHLQWSTHIRYEITTHAWHTYELTWSQTHGIGLYINGTLIHFTNESSTSTTTATTSGTLLIGKETESNYTASMMIVGLHIWSASHHILVQSNILTTVTAPLSTMSHVEESTTITTTTNIPTVSSEITTLHASHSTSSIVPHITSETQTNSSSINTDVPTITIAKSATTTNAPSTSTITFTTSDTSTNGIVSSPVVISTDQTTTVKHATIQSYNLTFTSIIGNVIATPTYNLTAHGTPTLVTLPTGVNAIQLNSSNGDFMELKNQSVPCYETETICKDGFTVQIGIHFLYVDSSQKTYIISSGGKTPGVAGFYMYYQNHNLYFGAAFGHLQWSTHIRYEITTHAWHTYELTWSQTHGIGLYINGTLIHSTNASSTSTTTATTSGSLFIGKETEANYTASMMIVGLHIWSASHHILVQSNVFSTATAPLSSMSHVEESTTTTTTTNIPTLVSSDRSTLHASHSTSSVIPHVSTSEIQTSSSSIKTDVPTEITTATSGSASSTTEPSTSTIQFTTHDMNVNVSSTNRVVSSTSVTSTDQTTTMKHATILSYNLTFTSIIGNVIATPTYNLTAHGIPTLVTLPTGVNAIQLNSSNGDFIELKNQSGPCLETDENCKNGFTLQIGIYFLYIHSSQKTYIISSGGKTPGVAGFYIYYQNHNIYFGAAFGNLQWSTNVRYEITTHAWHTYELTWSQTHGIGLYIDGTLVHSTNVASTFTTTATTSGSLFIGKEIEANYTASMMIVGLHIWSASHHILVQSNIFTTVTAPLFTMGHAEESTTTTTTTNIPTPVSSDRSTLHTSHSTSSVIPHITTSETQTSSSSIKTDVLAEITTPTSGDASSTTASHSTSSIIPHKTSEIQTSSSSIKTHVQTETTKIATTTNAPSTSPITFTTSDTNIKISSTNGIVSSPVLISTDKTTTVKHATILSYNLTFTSITGNVIATPTYNLTAHGTPTLVTLPTGVNAIQLNGSNGDFIELRNQSVPCLETEDKCDEGFTLQIGIHFLYINSSQKTYIILSGGQTPGVAGFYMYYQNHNIYFGAAFGHLQWTTNVRYEITTHAWHTYELTWSQTHGIGLYIDGTFVHSTNISSTSTTAATTSGSLFIGKETEANYTASMLIVGLHIWSASHHILVQSNIFTTVTAPLSSMSHEEESTTTTNIPTHVSSDRPTLHASHSTSSIIPYITTSATQTSSIETDVLAEITTATSGGASSTTASPFISSIIPHKTSKIQTSSSSIKTHVPTETTRRATTTNAPSTSPITFTTSDTNIKISSTNGIVSSPGVISTDQITTVKHATILSYNLTFTSVIDNVIATPTYNLTAHGTPTLITLPTGENAIQLNGSNGDFIELRNQSVPCLETEDKCDEGFTLQIGIHFLYINSSQKTYIILSGGQTPGVAGFYMYYQNHNIYFGAAFGHLQWTTHVRYEITTHAWHTYELTWSQTHGIGLYIDGTIVHSTNASSTSTTAATTSGSLFIGKETEANYTASMLIVGLHIWSASHHILVESNIFTTVIATVSTMSHVEESTTTTTSIPATLVSSESTTLLASQSNSSVIPHITTSEKETSSSSINTYVPAEITTSTLGGASSTTASHSTSSILPHKTSEIQTSSSSIHVPTETTRRATTTNAPSTSPITFTTSDTNIKISSTNGIVSSPGVISTDQTTTVKHATILSYNLTFTSITDNVIATPTYNLTAHGTPTLVTLPTGVNAIQLNGSNGDFIELRNQSVPCLETEDKCDEGFTLQIGIHFLYINSSQKTYIISSGGKTPGVAGFYMYYQNHNIYFGAAFGHLQWTTNVRYEITTHAWHTYELTWSQTYGIALYINGTRIHSTNASSTSTTTATTSGSLFIGKDTEANYTASMMIVGLHIWSASHQVLVESNVFTTKLTSLVTSSNVGGESTTFFTTSQETKTTNEHTTDSTSKELSTTHEYTIAISNSTRITAASPQGPAVYTGDTSSEFSTTVITQPISTSKVHVTTSSLLKTSESIMTTPTSKTSGSPFESSAVSNGDTSSISSTTTTSPAKQTTSSLENQSSTTPPTLVTNTFSTINHTLIMSYNFSFTSLIGNVITTPKYTLTAHGNLTLVKLPYGENAVQLNGSNGEFIELKNQSIPCIGHVDNCTHGLTLHISVNFLSIDLSNKTYILSSGGETPGVGGFYIYYQNQQFYFGAMFGNLHWSTNIKYEITTNVWHTYEFTWSQSYGIGLYIDGTLLKSTNISNITSTTSTPTGSLSIGAYSGATYTATMMITGLQFWQVSRQILVQTQTGITEPVTGTPSTTKAPTTAPQPTTTATIPTTTLPTTTQIHVQTFTWNFTQITNNVIVGNKYNLTVHGGPAITDGGLEFNSTNQYIEFGVNALDCLLNPLHCLHGLTVQFTIQLNKLEENTYLLTSGGQLPNGMGLAIIYRFGKIQFILSTTTHSWFATCGRNDLIPNRYHTVMLSWHLTTGLDVFVNNILIEANKVPTPHTAIVYNVTNVFFGKQPTTTSIKVEFLLQTCTIWYVSIDILVQQGICKPPVRPTDAPQTTTTPAKPATSTIMPPTTKPQTSRVSITSLITKTTAQQCPVGCVSVDSTTAKPTTASPTTLEPVTATSKPTTLKPVTSTSKPPTTDLTPPPPDTATPTIPATTTQKGAPDYNVKPSISVIVEKDEHAYLACTFTGAAQTDVVITVSLLVDGKVVLVQTVPGKAGISMFEVSKVNMNLYNKKIQCSVSAAFVGGVISTHTFISNIFTPTFVVTPGRVIVVEGHSTEFVTVTSKAPPQLYCCTGCKGDCQVHIVGSFHYSRTDQKCGTNVIAQAIIESTKPPHYNRPICGFALTISNWNQGNKIQIKATLDGRRDGDHTNTLDVTAHVYNQPASAQITVTPNTFIISAVQVTIKDNHRSSTCKSINDPHITSFDGLHYNNMNEGAFVMYRHPSLPFEVRAFYYKCSKHSHATCNCAVAVKSGDDVITVTGCQGSTGGHPGHPGQGHGIGLILQQLFGSHGNSHGHHNDELARTPMTIQIYKNGELTPGTFVRRYGCGQKYEIELPTGMIVTVQQSYKPFINIWIKGSSSDSGSAQGLCGNFDGSRGNDHGSASFVNLWKTTDANFFYGVGMSSMVVTSTYCSCVVGKQSVCTSGIGFMKCPTTSRHDITVTLVQQAKLPQLTQNARNKRQAAVTTTLATNIIPDEIQVTEAEARQQCDAHIMSNGVTKSCKPILTTNLTQQIDNCVHDYRATGSIEWATDAMRDIVKDCVDTANEFKIANETGNTNITDEIQLPDDIDLDDIEKILENACVDDCGEHGRCQNEICACDAGFSGVYCNISRATQPIVSHVPFLCDIATTSDCMAAVIFGINFVESTDLKCHYEYVNIGETIRRTGEKGQVPAIYISLNQVMCQMPRLQSAYIAVSNNGKLASSNESLHVAYSSVCHDCSVDNDTEFTLLCSRKNDNCIIDTVCYGKDAAKQGDSCQKCLPDISNSTWSQSNAAECIGVHVAQEQSDGMERTQVLILAVVCAVFAAIIICGVIYMIRTRSGKSKEKAEFGEYDVPTEPRLHREDTAMNNPTYVCDVKM